MGMVYVKKGVDLNGSHTAIIRATATIGDIYARYGVPCRITAGRDGKHMEGSLHYKGRARDFGIRWDEPHNKDQFDEITIDNIYRDIKADLGPAYDVVKERHHIHVEYDPK